MRIWIVLVPLLLIQPSGGQDQTGRRQVGDPPPPMRGTIHGVYDSFGPGPASLKALVKAADVIVEGRVDSIFPARLRNVNDPGSLETDTLFAADRVLKGKPEELRSVVVIQMGGKYGDLEVIIENEPPLKIGDRHILFLKYDHRLIVPTYPRTDGNFMVVSQWIGNFRIEDDKVKWLGPPNAGVFNKFENMMAEDFIAQILAEAAASQ